jgi:restriction system protein
MARRRSYAAVIAQAQRERQRVYAAQVRAMQQLQREMERQEKADARAVQVADKEQRAKYVERRMSGVEALNRELLRRSEVFEELLSATLDVDDAIDFDTLKEPMQLPTWEPTALDTPQVEPVEAAFLPGPQTGLGSLFGRGKHDQKVEAGRRAFQIAMAEYARQEAKRLTALARAQDEFRSHVREAEARLQHQHAEVDEFRAAFEAGEAAAVVDYFELVLQASQYPPDFAKSFRLAYVPESRQLVVEYELPSLAVVPSVKTYRYVKATDQVTESARPAVQIRNQYASVVAQVTLRTLHELFESDGGRNLNVVVFNGVLHTVDPGSGKAIKPCLVTVRCTREAFGDLDLAHVEPLACLKYLSAGVSKSAAELVPVRPVLEFDMVDPRFVAESDALGILDERDNLMELSPTDFEVLIQNLFTKMGLEAKQTRASRDGGVDCVAYDPRPIFGGKVVIQAKRYKNTVGVSAVRDLFGTLQNEGASKGILVTTSGYGQASFDFAKNKPIELIDGANLLYLLKAHTGMDAKIIPLDDWTDPRPDTPDVGASA